jgi:hypothetical protein
MDQVHTIPTHIARAYNLDVEDPISVSHIYHQEDLLPVACSTRCFKIPTSSKITWTNYKIAWIGPGAPQVSLLFSKNNTDTCLTLPRPATLKWEDLEWPIPGFRFLSESDGFYIRIDYPEISQTECGYLALNILGFEDLLPFHKEMYFTDKKGNSEFMIVPPPAPIHNTPAEFHTVTGYFTKTDMRYFLAPNGHITRTNEKPHT